MGIFFQNVWPWSSPAGIWDELHRSGWLLLFFFTSILLTGCATPDVQSSRPPRAAVAGIDATLLARSLNPVLAEHPELSGVHPLEQGVNAFVARMALASVAERTLDVQYYIWHSDDTGRLLAQRLIEAADRGVHVRLLLDDIGTNPTDSHLLALDNHPNIEVRLFNPVSNRTFRGLSFLLDLRRVNRRMHNKSFTADRQITIIGGRNIGDEYFGAGPEVEFADFDVVAIGPVVVEATKSFDLYWNSPSSVPMGEVNQKKVSAEWADQQRARLASACDSLQNSPYFQAARNSGLVKDIRERTVPWFWGRASLAYDLPGKVTTSPGDSTGHLTSQLRPVAEATSRKLLIVSPYFIPGPEGVEFFRTLCKRGVRVIIITNSLAATDVAAVHAGYRRYRKALLRAGVELYEFKASAAFKEGSEKNAANGSGSGSSRASLHAKTFVFDDQTIFVGSLNLDPRSISLNTEIGAVLEVPDLAGRIAQSIEQNALRNCYRVGFVPGPGPCKECGDVVWHDAMAGNTARQTSEPDASFGRRLLVAVLSLLPIESQL